MRATVTANMHMPNRLFRIKQMAEEEGAITQDALMETNSQGATIDAGGETAQCTVDGFTDEYPFEVDDMVSIY